MPNTMTVKIYSPDTFKLDDGIYTGMPDEVYFGLDAMNKSSLDCFKKSPKNYFANHLDPEREKKETTEPQKLGTAIHKAVLEPIAFKNEYAVCPEPSDIFDCLVTLDDYKVKALSLSVPVSGTKAVLKERILSVDPSANFYEDIVAEYSSKFKLISKKEMRSCQEIAKNLKHSDIYYALTVQGLCEVVLIWTDKIFGLKCKAKIDFLPADFSSVIDLKSTDDPREEEFIWSVKRYGYHRQAAWYCDGVFALTGVMPSLFIIVAVEKNPPFDNIKYALNDRAIEAGRLENSAFLARYAECKRIETWPGYDDDVKILDFNEWFYKNMDDKQNEVKSE